MAVWLWIIAIVLADQAVRWVKRRYGVNGIAWGGSSTAHPGWWLTRTETVYVRPARASVSGDQ